MSIGNLKTDGGKGTNYPWQRAMLKGISKMVTLMGGGSTPAGTRVPDLDRTTGSGTIKGAYSASFANVGTADARVLLTDVKPGETVNFDAGNFILDDIVYDASVNPGAELLIATISPQP